MIHVVGGTYLEDCRERNWKELFGSGLRASLALARLGSKVEFSTFIDKKQKQVLLAKSDGITVSPVEVKKTIVFNYLHTLSTPSIEPENYVRLCGKKPKQVEISGDKVLSFGMMEGNAKVKARMATYDPQSPADPKFFGENGSEAEKLAIVVNRSEAKQMTGRTKPEDACKELLKKGATVAIVKCGPDGCLVGASNSKVITTVPAYRASRVWPIGSGDVFSALFAHGWMELNMKPVEAADRASKGTCHFVETRLPPSEEDLKKKFTPLKRLPRREFKKIYLAGPFFNLSQRWLIEEFRLALLEEGMRVFSPLHDVGPGEAMAIYEPDMKGLRESQVILACLDGLDPGTIYEIGYAHSQESEVIAFVSAERPEDMKMIEGGGSQMTNDFATAFYATIWAATCK
jgi:nucleoside 2-deoxyribosyltransferase